MNQPLKTPKANDKSVSGTRTVMESGSSKDEYEPLVRPEQPSGVSRHFVDTSSLTNSSAAIPFPTGTTNSQSSARAQPDKPLHGNIIESSFLQPLQQFPQVGQPVEWHTGIVPESTSVVRSTPLWRQRQKDRLRRPRELPPPGCVERSPRCPECKKQKKVYNHHTVLIEGAMFPVQERSLWCLRSVQETGISRCLCIVNAK
jgi:hypothetical protein